LRESTGLRRKGINIAYNVFIFNFAGMISFSQFSLELSYKLNNSPLPGIKAQMQMAPVSRKVELERRPIPEPKKSAVLISFFSRNEAIYLIMIKRAIDDSVHSGQIAFPGGKAEMEDATLENTALRETFEEIGIEPSKIEILGKLTELYIPPSNFLVTPFVGILKEEPHFITNNEVESVLVVPLAELLDPANCIEKTIMVRTLPLHVPCYLFEREIVWCASSMMLAELLQLLSLPLQ